MTLYARWRCVDDDNHMNSTKELLSQLRLLRFFICFRWEGGFFAISAFVVCMSLLEWTSSVAQLFLPYLSHVFLLAKDRFLVSASTAAASSSLGAREQHQTVVHDNSCCCLLHGWMVGSLDGMDWTGCRN